MVRNYGVPILRINVVKRRQKVIITSRNQSTDSTDGSIVSLSVGSENGPEQGLKIVSFNP